MKALDSDKGSVSCYTRRKK